MDVNHKNKIRILTQLWSDLESISELAKDYGINDIFQDNGAKLLQQLLLMNFKNTNCREGNDAIDENGIEWELKSANISLVKGFSTHHHLNHEILKKYRSVPWLFSMYENIQLKEIYVMQANVLENIFSKWELKLNAGMDSINNPKIPISFVRDYGVRVYPYKNPPINPASIIIQN